MLNLIINLKHYFHKARPCIVYVSIKYRGKNVFSKEAKDYFVCVVVAHNLGKLDLLQHKG